MEILVMLRTLPASWVWLPSIGASSETSTSVLLFQHWPMQNKWGFQKWQVWLCFHGTKEDVVEFGRREAHEWYKSNFHIQLSGCIPSFCYCLLAVFTKNISARFPVEDSLFSSFFYQIYAALNIFFGMASIGLLTVVAIDRFLTICRADISIWSGTSALYTSKLCVCVGSGGRRSGWQWCVNVIIPVLLLLLLLPSLSECILVLHFFQHKLFSFHFLRPEQTCVSRLIILAVVFQLPTHLYCPDSSVTFLFFLVFRKIRASLTYLFCVFSVIKTNVTVLMTRCVLFCF